MSTEAYAVISQPVVNLTVTTNLTSFASERRFDKSISISSLKGKLELITGASSSNMQLELYDKEDKLVTRLDNADALLGSLPVEDGMRLHVFDKTHQPGEFEDTSKVEKFVLPDEEYSKRDDSVRAFLARNKLGKYSDDSAEMEKQKELQEKEEEELANKIPIDSRIEVRVPGQLVRRGSVMFVGKVHFKPGWWIGVKYDEPYGKNDGSVEGKRYFECIPKYGGFVKPQHITVGEFPEEGIDLDDEM